MNYWLFKSEPDAFSIDDLANAPNRTEPWDGVRNYQARNFLRDQVQVGDSVLFYHSSCKPAGIVGIATVSRAGYPDTTAFDPESAYYDPKSTPEQPRWYRVDITFQEKFPRMLTLDQLKREPALATMPLLRKGNRLSIMPVAPEHWTHILQLARRPA